MAIHDVGPKKSGDAAPAEPPPGSILHPHDVLMQQEHAHPAATPPPPTEHHVLTEVSHGTSRARMQELLAMHPDHADAPAHAHPAATPAPAAHLDPATQALIDKMNAINANMIAEIHKAEAKQKEHAFKQQVMGPAAMMIAGNLSRLAFTMNDANSKAFIQQLDSINDPDMRAAVKEQFKIQHMGEDLEHFISHCDDWNNNGDNRDKKAALQLISKERDQAETNLQEMDPKQREAMEKKAREDAGKFLAATAAHDHSDENMQKIFRTMGHKSPEEIELMRQAVSAMSAGHTNIYQAIDDGTHKGDEDEAVAMLEGNPVHSARAALTNETDPKRMREVLGALTKDEVGKLDPFFKAQVLARFDNPSDRAEVAAMFNQDTHLADAEHLGNLLKPKDQGLANGEFNPYSKIDQENYDRRKPKNVIKEFEGMSGEDVKAAAASWDKAHAGEPGFKTFKELLKDRWGDDDDKTELNRLTAMIDGDKEKNRSLRFEEGQRKKDQDEIEASLAHDSLPSKEELTSEDPKVKENAIKKQEDISAREAKFEKYNVEDDQKSRKEFLESFGVTPTAEMIAPRSSKQQLTDYYDARAKDDIGSSFDEKMMGGKAADWVHAKRQDDHDKEVQDHRAGAMDMLDTGHLSVAVEMHRAKSSKDKLAVAEKVKDNDELAEQEKKALDLYGKPLIPVPDDDYDDQSTAEVQLGQLKDYGVKSQRPANLEHRLQAIVYKHAYSESLEADEAGRLGTQSLQRYELEAQGDMLEKPGFQLNGPTVVTEPHTGMKIVVDDPHDASEGTLLAGLPPPGTFVRPTKEHPLDPKEDGLKKGVTKEQFNQQDEALSLASEAQQDAKKRMAERLIKIFSTIAKIAAALTLQPELIAAIDIAEGVLEIVLKKQIIGKDYSMKDDLKMLAITGVADIALMGFAKYGKGAAKVAEEVALKEAESIAVHEAEAGLESVAKGEIEAEVKHEATAELEHVAQNELESKVTQAAEGKVAGEVEGVAAKEVEQQVAKEVENEGIKATENAAENAAKEQLSPAEIAKKVEAQWGMYGNAAKMVIQTVGGGIATGKSPSEILKGLITGGLGLVIPGAAGEKIRGAIGNETAAAKILGELFGTSAEYISALTINVAGGAEPGDAALDTLIGVGGGRVQHYAGGHGGGAKHEESAPTPERSPAPEAGVTAEPVANREPVASMEPVATSEPASAKPEPTVTREAPIAPEIVTAPEPTLKVHETPVGPEALLVTPSGTPELLPSVAGEPNGVVANEAAPERPPETVARDPEPSPAAIGGADSGTPFTERNSETAWQRSGNAERVINDAANKMGGMDAPAREAHAELFQQTENLTQQVLLERAIAANASIEDLQSLVSNMKGKGETELLLTYTGAGLVQYFKGSCVPAAHQIVLGNANPVEAMRMKADPVSAFFEQKASLLAAGGAQNPRTSNEAIDRIRAESPALAAVMDNSANYNPETKYTRDGVTPSEGIDPSEMKALPQHDKVEHALNTKMEVLGAADVNMAAKDGSFDPNNLPHDRIKAAVFEQRDVIVAYQNHQQVIHGFETVNGVDYYVLQDPQTAAVKRVPVGDLNNLNVQSLILPVAEPSHVPSQPTGEGGSTAIGAEPIRRRPGEPPTGTREPYPLPEMSPEVARPFERAPNEGGAPQPESDYIADAEEQPSQLEIEIKPEEKEGLFDRSPQGAGMADTAGVGGVTSEQMLSELEPRTQELLDEDHTGLVGEHVAKLYAKEQLARMKLKRAREKQLADWRRDNPDHVDLPLPPDNNSVGAYKAQVTEVSGEIALTKAMLDERAKMRVGFTPGRGFDQGWEKPGEQIVGEAKGQGAELGNPPTMGNQMGNNWTGINADRAERAKDPNLRAFGHDVADVYDRTVPQGNFGVTGRVIEDTGDGSYIERLPDEVPPLYGLPRLPPPDDYMPPVVDPNENDPNAPGNQ